jgi:hypothetical protein
MSKRPPLGISGKLALAGKRSVSFLIASSRSAIAGACYPWEPVVVPTTEPPTVSPLLSRRGSQRTARGDFDGSPRPQQLNKPPPPKLPAVPLGGRRRREGR